MPKTVKIELTEKQARVVLAAVEEWFRLRMGQYHDTANGLAFLDFNREDGSSEAFNEAIIRRNHITTVLRAAMDIAFPTPRPISNTSDVHIASDIWSQLRWELSTKDEWMSTPFQMGSEPMPKVIVEEV